jgi:hypothetical protein
VRAAVLLLALALPAAEAEAATAYVTDELVLGVYANPKGEGPRLATLHSGATVETLGPGGETTPVRLADGTTGWVKTAYLTSSAPAVVRIKQLQDELDRTHATTPELAEAAERSEVLRLKSELEQAEHAASAANATPGATPGAAVDEAAVAAATTGAGSPERTSLWTWPVLGWLCCVLAALCVGFWLGHALLARRIREKFGGMKVY